MESKKEMITFVLTACGRPDLLEKTLDSFLKFNTHPIKKYIIIEDSGKRCNEHLEKKYDYLPFIWIYNERNMGQIYSVDRAYKEVDTEYIFHCEDDWEFYRSGFIEESLMIMKMERKCLQVWLREHNDTNGHPIEQGICYGVVSSNYKWKGFTFNPTLKRWMDYLPYSKITNRRGGANAENEIGVYYHRRGYWCAILNEGAVKHLGDERNATKQIIYSLAKK